MLVGEDLGIEGVIAEDLRIGGFLVIAEDLGIRGFLVIGEDLRFNRPVQFITVPCSLKTKPHSMIFSTFFLLKPTPPLPVDT